VAEELAVLNDPATYEGNPDEAWRRIKTRTSSGRFLAIVRELARFRETYAQERNVPRNRVFKDDALVELASTKPQNEQDLSRSRLLLREARKGDIAQGIIAGVQAGLAVKPEDMPEVDNSRAKLQVNPALAEMLRVLLKSKTDNEGVAQKLIASSSDLDALAAGERDVPALKGWRREVFGHDAIRLCEGQVGLAVKGQKVVTVTL
jgi:ribonuclease D